MTMLVLEGQSRVVPDDEAAGLISERQRLGHDRYDEVWEGVYHVAPDAHSQHGQLQAELVVALMPRARAVGLMWSGTFNLGEPDDYRVPDGAARVRGVNAVYLQTAVVVAEVLSPGDASLRKFDFYFRHGVQEVLIVDPVDRTCRFWTRADSGFATADGSQVLDVTGDALAGELDWD